MKIISLIFVIILFYCAEPVSRISSAQPSNLKTANTTSLYPIEKLNDGRFRMSSEILVLGTPRIVEIIYQQGSEGFASYHLEYAVKFIPKIADYFQIAPTQTVFRITQLTDGSTDRNEGTSVFFHLENQFSETKGLPTGHPLLFHEIGHWWFGQNPRFIAEGVSSFLPIAIMNEGLINFDKKEINDIYSWWGFYNPKIVDDVPLGDNEYKEKTGYPGFSLNYEKSFKIQYIIYNELGKDKYKIFLKSLLDYQNINENWVLKVPEFSNTTGIFSALNKQKTFDWKKFLSGWIIEKNYRGLSLSEWSDTDLDGLLDVQERYYGTDKKIPDTDGDSLADGTEIEIGSNPLKRETPIEIEKLVSESGPFIDGFSGDWDVIKNKKVLQSSPNPKLQGRFDLIEFSFIIKNKTFYGMIKTREKPFFDSLSEKDMYFFFSDTAEPKFRDGFGMWYSPSARLGWEYGRKSGKSVIPEGRLAEVFEFKISIPDSDPRYMKLYPIIRHGKKNENFGIWDNYKEIMIQF